MPNPFERDNTRGADTTRFENAVDAVVSGDLALLERLLRADPDLIHARSTRPHRATLLHYVGANGVEEQRQRTPANAIAVATLLLDAGADINARANIYGGSDTLGLVATSVHPLRAGVQEDLMALLLSRGATVAGASGGASSSSLINGCLANGRPGAAEFLAHRVERLDLEAAAGLGRLDVVTTFFDEAGALTGGATSQQMHDGFSWACEYGRTEVVDFLLRHGVNAGARLRPHQQTGLHWAAFGGHDATVRVLLAHNPPLDVRDASFDGTPLGWALYAWGGGRAQSVGGRYYDVVEQLVAAGATVAEEWLNESGRGFPLAKKINEDAHMRGLLARDAP
jgi:ankyrin repeat protein